MNDPHWLLKEAQRELFLLSSCPEEEREELIDSIQSNLNDLELEVNELEAKCDT